VTSLRQALTVTTDPVEEADLLERAGESASTAGHHEEADVLLRRAIEIQRGRGDRPAIARSTAALGRALLAPFRTIAAIAVLEPAAEEFADLGDDPGAVALLGQLARAYMLNEEPARAVEAADRALAAAELADFVELGADTLITKGTALASLRRGYEGAAEIDGGMRLAEAHGLTSIILRGKINRSATLFESDPVAALEITRSGYFESQRLGLRRRAIVFLMNSIEAGVSVGEWDWALPELEEWLTVELEPEDRIVLLSPQIQIRAWRGESVSDLIDEVQHLRESTNDPSSLFTGIIVQALAKFALGNDLEAADLFGQAATLSASNAPSCHMMAGRASLLVGDAAAAARSADELKRTGMHGPFIEARRMELAAGLAALEGRPAEALPLFAEVLRRYQVLGVQIDQAFAAIEMASLLDPTLPEVVAAGDVAREILVRLRAKPFIARLDAALARTPGSDGASVGASAPARKSARGASAKAG